MKTSHLLSFSSLMSLMVRFFKINDPSLKFILLCIVLLLPSFTSAQSKKKKNEKGSVEVRGFEYVGKNNQGYELYEHVGLKKGGIIIQLATHIKFVLVEPGSFKMGTEIPPQVSATPLERKWAMLEPAHLVTLSHPFLMAEIEVPQKIYEKVMRESPWVSYIPEDPDYPASRLLWKNIQKFLERTGTELPTEAQWEYAARAGSTTTYYWGNEMSSSHCWYKETSRRGGQKYSPSKGKTKTCNRLGLYDMSGNVWEVCQDWFGPYPKDSIHDPKGPDAGKGRVIRGGSFNSPAYECRSASRRENALKVHWQNDNIGLRLIKNVR